VAEHSGLLLVDTDMLILLAASGLLGDVASTIGYSSDQLRRLSATPHQVRKSKRLRDAYGEAVLQRIAPFIGAITDAEPPSDLALLDSLNSFVDEGEAQLMALAASQDRTLLMSGDKRAVIGLAESNATACIDSLQGKVVSLEAVLWSLLAHRCAEDVRKAFTPVLGHVTLKIVLSEHAASDQVRCREGVRSYYNDLHRQAKGVLYNPAPDQLGL